MPDATVTVIVPTTGRSTLYNTIESIPAEWQIIVVCDGPHATQKARQIRNAVRARIIPTPLTQDVGHTQRNIGMRNATSDWLAFMDDDDTYTPNVSIRVQATVPHIFQMRYPNGNTLWNTKTVAHGNVGTPMFIVPNNPRKLGRWPSQRSGDFDFIRDTCQLYDDPPRFVEQVIALVRPHEK